MSEEIDELRRGGLRRILLVVAGLAAVAVAVAWARAGRDRGEPELAHRVLIVGGTPTDLVEAIVEAGFEATQISWSEAETECANPDGQLDVEALIECADERGAGFVALMFGDDMVFEPTILGEVAPEHAIAAVVSVGELALEQPRVQFGAPPDRIEYAPGMQRREGLRMALYEHPDVLALWDDPTSEQQRQRVELGDLDEARTLLARALDRYRAASQAWPSDWPADAIVQPWTELDAMPVLGGRVVREVALSPRVDARRIATLQRAPARLRFVPDQGPAIATTIDPLAEQRLAPDRSAGLQRDEQVWLRWRIEAGTPKIAAETAWTPAFEQEPSPMAWLDEQLMVRAALVFEPELEDTGVSEVLAFVLAFVDVPTSGRPRVVGIRLTDLPHAATSTIVSLHPTQAGLYMIVEVDEAPEGSRTLLRLDLDLARLRAAMVEIADEMATLDAIATALRTPTELGTSVNVVELGPLPSFVPDSLDFAPDGSWLAWRSPGGARAIWSMSIVHDQPTTPVRIGEGSNDPKFSADSMSVVLTVERTLGELGPVHTLRVVPKLPS